MRGWTALAICVIAICITTFKISEQQKTDVIVKDPLAQRIDAVGFVMEPQHKLKIIELLINTYSNSPTQSIIINQVETNEYIPRRRI